MKTLGKYFAFIVLVIAGTWLFSQQVRAQNDDYDDNSVQNYIPQQNEPVTLQVFYDELSPYGTWVNDPNYGYVWIPNVDQNFIPYVTNGHWVNTDLGWTWVSDFSWGWAPFHYGRWAYDPQYGNIWIPDTVWGPAWVSWRQANGYIGWTALGPGVDISFAMGGSYNVPYNRWNFVPYNDFLQDDLYRYRLSNYRCYNIFNLSFLIRNTRYDNDRHSSYFYGPRREDVQRYSGRIINPVHIRDYNRPGQSFANGYLNIYRPKMQRSNAYGGSAEPRSIRNSMEGRNVQNNYRSYGNPNGRPYSTGRGVQAAQEPNQNSYRSQAVQQPSRYTNSGYQGRGVQTAQEPNQNSYRSQAVQNPSRYAVSNNPGRGAQAVFQQRNQREERAVQNVQSNYRQQEARMSSNASPQRSQPASNPREGNSRESYNTGRGRR